MTAPARKPLDSEASDVSSMNSDVIISTIRENTAEHGDDTASNDPIESFRHSNLTDVRNRLLDLTARNPLLNLKHTPTKTLRFVNTSPDSAWRALSSGTAVVLSPVPEPTDKQRTDAGYLEIDPTTGEHTKDERPKADVWARYLNIPTEYELAEPDDEGAATTRKKTLQTLSFQDALDGRLRKIGNLASTSVEERGASILYLVFGYLEWYDKPTSNDARLAPLLIEPAALSRSPRSTRGGVREHLIEAGDEDALDNLSLAEKLRSEFDLTLPGRAADEALETWFVRIERIVQERDPRWKVRRQISLCLLNFTKQALYQDLDPERWPPGKALQDHPIIARFFSTDGGDDRDSEPGTRYLAEHRIDDLAQAQERYPLIADADSSQHSAIVDVIDGRNLVIEGPPGTGKSQTITNLIAAAMAAGKRVLFVAEKMDALDVVACRLRDAGLGDFLLELHSHKSNKLALLESLVSAAGKRGSYTDPTALDSRIAWLTETRTELGRTAAAMNTPWRDTKLTPHEILQRATERRELCPDVAPQVTGIASNELGLAALEDTLHTAERLVSAFDALSAQADGEDIRAHLWFGVNRAEFMGGEREALFATLGTWNDHLMTVAHHLHALADELGPSASARLTPEDVDRLALDLARLPDAVPTVLFERIDELAENVNGLVEMRDELRALRARFDGLAGCLREPVLEIESAAAGVRDGLRHLEERLGVPDTQPLKLIESHAVRLAAFEGECLELQREIATLKNALPETLHLAMRPTREGWKELTDILEMAATLPADLWGDRDARLDHPGIPSLLENLRVGVLDLQSRRESIEGVFELDDLPSSSTLLNWSRTLNSGGFFGWFRADVRAARRSLKMHASSGRVRHRALVDALPALRGYREALDALDATNHATPLLGPLYKGLDTPLPKLSTLSDWYESLAGRFGRGTHDDARIGRALRELDAYEAHTLIAAISTGTLERLAAARRELSALEVRFPRLFATLTPNQSIVSVPASASDDDSSHDLDGASEEIMSESGLVPAIRQELTRALATVQPAIKDPNLTLGELREIGATWRLLLADTRKWRATSIAKLTVPTLFDLALVSTRDAAPADVDLDTAIALGSVAISTPLLGEALRRPDPQATMARLTAARGPLLDACHSARSAREEFMTFGEVDESCWMGDAGTGLEALVARNALRLNHRPWLETWLGWQRVKARDGAGRLTAVIGALERGTLRPEDVPSTIEASVYGQLAEYLLAESPEIAGIDGLHQNPLREQFARIDREVQSLQRERIAYRCTSADIPVGNGQGAVGSYTEMSLVQHEHGKKKRHVAIRRLMSRSSGAIGAIKPCFMMSPMSVAQYLEPGHHEFDLVVMDEASQIRPEEALGAIGRAKQLVVVGDPRQLPPTSFFDKNSDDSDDEESVGLQQSESILDAVLPMFDKRRLRWHYRSRHTSLIAFSNAKFYDSNLVLFPSPQSEGQEYGLKFERVTTGCCNEGTNLVEAARIAEFLAEQLTQRPTESVGVVSMNVKQAEAIQVALESLAKHDPLVGEAVDRACQASEPLFIKNLERVQGNERDVIIISMTYGPITAGGRTPQRFGPINSPVGWRRLNVLLTRAKKRMQVFASMGSADVLEGGTTSRGKTALRDFLSYCESGHLHAPVHTGRSPDSAFEVAVIRRLAAEGYEAEPQLGVAGFFLDLAVRDPDDPGRYLLAIECDGATYHSAKSARDRDRLRQEILENLGWRMHRIWSTDWFRNPEAQMTAVLKSLEHLRRRH